VTSTKTAKPVVVCQCGVFARSSMISKRLSIDSLIHCHSTTPGLLVVRALALTCLFGSAAITTCMLPAALANSEIVVASEAPCVHECMCHVFVHATDLGALRSPNETSGCHLGAMWEPCGSHVGAIWVHDGGTVLWVPFVGPHLGRVCV
jgi:hypothetical protein